MKIRRWHLAVLALGMLIIVCVSASWENELRKRSQAFDSEYKAYKFYPGYVGSKVWGVTDPKFVKYLDILNTNELRDSLLEARGWPILSNLADLEADTRLRIEHVNPEDSTCVVMIELDGTVRKNRRGLIFRYRDLFKTQNAEYPR